MHTLAGGVPGALGDAGWAHVHARVCVCINAHTRAHMGMHACAHYAYMHIHLDVYMCAQMYTHMHVMHMHTDVCMYACIYLHAYECTHICA